MACTWSTSRVQCRSVGVVSPIIPVREQAASTACMGCLLCAGYATPYAGSCSFAAKRAPWIEVVPVLCGPMCSRRVPAGSGVGFAGAGAPSLVQSAGFVQSVSMVKRR